jgi:hypothetical protein
MTLFASPIFWEQCIQGTIRVIGADKAPKIVDEVLLGCDVCDPVDTGPYA